MGRSPWRDSAELGLGRGQEACDDAGAAARVSGDARVRPARPIGFDSEEELLEEAAERGWIVLLVTLRQRVHAARTAGRERSVGELAGEASAAQQRAGRDPGASPAPAEHGRREEEILAEARAPFGEQ